MHTVSILYHHCQASALLLDLAGCDWESDSPGLFDPADPTGEYKLDASLPYSRMVISELLAISEVKKGYEVRELARSRYPLFTCRVNVRCSCHSP